MPFVRRKPTRKTRAKRSTISSNTKKIKQLTTKVNRQETPSVTFIEKNADKDIFTTPVVELLDVSASLPSTVTTTKTILDSIWVKGLLELDTAGADTQIARIAIVQDMRKFDNNVSPLWLDVFETTSVYSHRTDALGGDKKRSFKVLHDKTFTLTKDADATVMSRKLVTFFTKFGKNGMQQFDYDEYSKNLLYIMYVSTAATTVMDFNYDLKIRMSKDA